MTALAFAQRVTLVPYGVLGQQMKLDKTFVQHVPEPCSVDGCCFVDPAGLHHIQPPGGPANAHGAAGAIYKSIGIDKAVSFPADVVGAITKPGDAKYHKYAKVCPRGASARSIASGGGVVVGEGGNGGGVEQRDVHVLHTVGPDLRTEPDPVGAPGVHYTRAQAVEALARTYCNVLGEFVHSSGQLHTLRLLPVSGGIFAGEFMKDIGPLTMEALMAGFDLLSKNDQAVLMGSEITVQMCIFAEKELPLFEGAGFVLEKKRSSFDPSSPLLLGVLAVAVIGVVSMVLLRKRKS